MAIFGKETNEFRELIENLKEIILQQKNVLMNIKELYGVRHFENESVISVRIKELMRELSRLNERIPKIINEIIVPKVISQHILGTPEILIKQEKTGNFSELEKETLKRLKKEAGIIKKEKEYKKIVKEDSYAKFANKLFSRYSKKLIEKDSFKALQVDLEKSNLMYLFPTYISIILFTTLLATVLGLIIFTFFLFFSIQPHSPIIKLVEDIGSRSIKLIWVLIVFPIAGFLFSYSYPSLDRSASEAQIDSELPFATVNMAAISNSLINPVKIFEIIVSSDEFPNVKKEFTKIINYINVHGNSIVNALIATAYNTPSKKMSELLSGLAATINSGGDLTGFFETRAETLLFDYKLKREKETKTAETFMDLYISIVIAAPMIFMLLLMIMKISGLGISIPISTITLMMVGGVAMINIFFIIFLHLKKTD